MYYRSGLWGLVVLIADIWAIVNILQSGADTGKKVLWTAVSYTHLDVYKRQFQHLVQPQT